MNCNCINMIDSADVLAQTSAHCIADRKRISCKPHAVQMGHAALRSSLFCAR
jgi:hypothetical protein